jgi:predicted TIM-barrel fold metal-dependent hydrolase
MALPFPVFDADNHYYEAEDAFIRHMPKPLRKRAVQWAEVNGRKRLLVAGRVNKFIPNPTFDPVTKPGALDAFFRGKNTQGLDPAALFGELEPIRPAYRDRDARLELMDEQGVERILLFPTQAVGIEQPLRRDAEITHATLHAFNEWLLDDWGFNYRDRIYAVPLISLMDPERAVGELEWCLERDAVMVHVRAAPVPGAGRSRSLGDASHDPFWARVCEAGIPVAFHAGDHGYGRYAADWGESGPMEAFRANLFGMVTQAGRAIFDSMAALVLHGVFERHPGLRVYSVENGAEWVPYLLDKLKKAHGQMPQVFKEDPVETFRRHVWVSPYYEDDIRDLADRIGVERVVFGSDFPHAEGLAEPVSFVDDMPGFSDAEIRQVMRENALRLITPAPA